MSGQDAKKSLRSQTWFGSKDKDGFSRRSWMKNQGLPHHLFDGRPVIGICNNWSELASCNWSAPIPADSHGWAMATTSQLSTLMFDFDKQARRAGHVH